MSDDAGAGKSGENMNPRIVGERPANYAGDVSVEEAWRLLRENPASVLVDVRTRAEWSFVGVTDLSAAGKEPVFAEWQTFPSMAVNQGFVTEVSSALASAGRGKDTPVVFLCRTGARSKAAAIAMTAQGFSACYNIQGGFEGDLDAARHRGRGNGWKAGGLPWVQS